MFTPKYRDPDSGYRYYAYNQVYRLANIVFLRKQAYSLEEIKDYLQKASMEGRLKNLRKQTSQLDRETINDKIMKMRDLAARDGNKTSPESIHYNIIDQFVARSASEYITEIHLPLVEDK